MDKSCADRIDEQYEDTMDELRRLWRKYLRGNNEIYEYGLSFDYVTPDTFDEQSEGYFRWQFSWGGPSDEMRFFTSGPDAFEINSVEYWFMDWFDGAHIDLTGEDLSLVMEIFDSLFVETEMCASNWEEPEVEEEEEEDEYDEEDLDMAIEEYLSTFTDTVHPDVQKSLVEMHIIRCPENGATIFSRSNTIAPEFYEDAQYALAYITFEDIQLILSDIPKDSEFWGRMPGDKDKYISSLRNEHLARTILKLKEFNNPWEALQYEDSLLFILEEIDG